jgi:transposase
MLKRQTRMLLSPYLSIYDKIIPKDNVLRQMKELVDFSFIHEELQSKYCLDNGRNAIDPVILFKYLLLKAIFKLSDRDVVERSRYDMSFKYFLDLEPEAEVIDASTLTKFRKLRLKDSNLLDLLIGKTVEIALDKGIIKSKAIIVDSTHTRARYHLKSPGEVLLEYSKDLRKAVYEVNEKIKGKFPKKVDNGLLEDEIEYCRKLIEVIKSEESLLFYPSVTEKMNLLEESIEDELENIELSKDEDAKVGHKTADTSFFGYKAHLAMTEERIITAATVTSGEKADGKELIELIEKSKKNGIDVEEVLGDTAYSEKDNLEYTKEKNIKLISKLHPLVSNGTRKKEEEFFYNKDAGMYVCKQGHMAVRKAKHQRKNSKENPRMFYYFDIEKCKRCPQREGCYEEGSKSKVYTVAIKSEVHKEQQEFQESEYFKERAKERYKIEAKNSELKNRHGFDVASSSGLLGMQLQGACTIFAVNMKRIIKLLG